MQNSARETRGRRQTHTAPICTLPTEQRRPDPAVLRQRGRSQAAGAAEGREMWAESRDAAACPC